LAARRSEVSVPVVFGVSVGIRAGRDAESMPSSNLFSVVQCVELRAFCPNAVHTLGFLQNPCILKRVRARPSAGTEVAMSRTAKHQEIDMPRGDKSSYTNKQKRQAEHIEDSYKKRGLSTKTAESRAWATVNKETGGGKKGGGKKKAAKKSSSRKTAAKKAGARKKTAGRKSAAKKSSRSRK
jgi:hypothetical protein